MREELKRAGVALIAMALGTTAHAAAPQAITRPEWAQKPSGEDLERFYPERAKAEEMPGRATIACRVTAEGLLTECVAEQEQPLGYGFGEAAVSLSTVFRMKPKTVDGAPVDGGTITIPIAFQVPPAAALGDFAIVLTKIDPGQPLVPMAESDGLVIDCPTGGGECRGHYLEWLSRPSDEQTAAILAPAASVRATGATCLIATDGLLEGCEFSGDTSPQGLAAATATVKLLRASPYTLDGVPTALAEVLIPFFWSDLVKQRDRRKKAGR